MVGPYQIRIGRDFGVFWTKTAPRSWFPALRLIRIKSR